MNTGPRAVADAVLYEGFLLYPYTCSTLKNQSRWQFGVLMPRGYADPSEPSEMETHVLASPGGAPSTIEIVARFLHVEATPVEREVAMHALLREGEQYMPFRLDDLHGSLACVVERDGNYLRITVRLRNKTRIKADSNRNAALEKALVSAHVLLTIHGSGAFVSLLDPPDEAKDAAARCKNRRFYPVLAGEPGEGQTAQTVLASPIILYDFPAIAPQSTGETFDGTEIDELLLLSVASMTDEEKREARAADERAKAIVDRAEALTSSVQRSLHGRIETGSRVRIHPKRRADAFDMFAEGQTARVTGLVDDVDGRSYVSVVFDADPASDLHRWYGRSFFYERDEVEPVGDES